MTIQAASWNDILSILRQNHSIWSAGLSKADYRHYVWSQLQAAWSRNNLHYLVYRVNGQVATSCKIYELGIRTRGKTYNVAGLGAIFTQESFRGRGLAKKLIRDVIDRCKAAALDGILLYSDLDPSFYLPFDFVQFGSADFTIFLPGDGHKLEQTEQIDNNSAKFMEHQTACLKQDNEQLTLHAQLLPGVGVQLIAEIARCHSQWLSRQPFGIERSVDYIAYKLGREHFIASRSKLNWPEIVITTTSVGEKLLGYALTECSGTTMRILEVIGPEATRLELWQHLYQKANSLGIKRLRGWESAAADFAPTYSYKWLNPHGHTDEMTSKILSFERDWGQPMMLAFNSALQNLPNVFPCPFLELDL